jgi:hypothetical protein
MSGAYAYHYFTGDFDQKKETKPKTEKYENHKANKGI